MTLLTPQLWHSWHHNLDILDLTVPHWDLTVPHWDLTAVLSDTSAVLSDTSAVLSDNSDISDIFVKFRKLSVFHEISGIYRKCWKPSKTRETVVIEQPGPIPRVGTTDRPCARTPLPGYLTHHCHCGWCDVIAHSVSQRAGEGPPGFIAIQSRTQHT